MIYTAGKRLRASDLADLTAAAGAWTTYAPVLTSSGTAFAIGDGTAVGSYRKVGQTVDVRAIVTMGAGTTFGTGTYRLSLPYAPKTNSLISAYCDDNSASQRWAGQARIILASTTGDNMRIIVSAASGAVTNGVPFTWAASDVLILDGTYEVN